MRRELILTIIGLSLIVCGKKHEQVESTAHPLDTVKPRFDTIATAETMDTVPIERQADSTPLPLVQIDTVKTIEKRSVKIKSAVKAVKKSPKNDTVKSAIVKVADPLQFDTSPRTTQEAFLWSLEHYKEAQRLMDRGKAAEALRHVERAIKLCENGSLFVLKARCLNVLGYESAAITAADRALVRGNYWEPESYWTALEQKAAGLDAAYRKTPSKLLRKELDETIERMR